MNPRVLACMTTANMLYLAAICELGMAQGPHDLRLLPPTVLAPDTDWNAAALPPPREMEMVFEDASGPWYLPHVWQPSELWEGSVELGMNASRGNADSFAMRTGADVTKNTDLYEFSADIDYAKTEANDHETQHSLLFDSQYDWLLGESPWSIVSKFNLEYDEFKAFDVRLALNCGVGRSLLESELGELKAKFGAGWSREIGGPDKRYVPEAAFGLDYEHQLTSKQKLTGEAQFLPEWENFGSYRVLTDLSWEILLDEATNLNLKLGVNDRYDSTPNGAKPNDLLYSLVLLWKL